MAYPSHVVQFLMPISGTVLIADGHKGGKLFMPIFGKLLFAR